MRLPRAVYQCYLSGSKRGSVPACIPTTPYGGKGGTAGSSCPTYAESLSEDIAADSPAEDSPAGSLATVFSISALNLDTPLDRTRIVMNDSTRCCDAAVDDHISQGELIADTHRYWHALPFPCTVPHEAAS